MTEATAAVRRARVAVSAVFFIDGAGLGGYVSHLPDVQNKLHLSNEILGFSILFSAIGAVTTMPLSGWLIHRFGSRGVSLFAGMSLALALPLLAIAPSRWAFCAALYLVGASNGQLDVAMNAHSMAVQDRFPRPMLSAVHGWFSVGGFAGGAGTALAARLGVGMLTHMVAASILLLAVLFAGVRGMLPSDVDKDAAGPRLALPTGRVLLLGVLVIFAFVTEGALWDWCAVYLRRGLGATAAIGALGFALASMAMAAGRLGGDEWTHRSGYRRVLLGSALLAGGGIFVAVSFGSIPAAILGFAIAGLGIANMVPVLFRAAGSMPGVSASAGLAAVATCGYTGFLAGPATVGYLADRTSLATALAVTAGLPFIVAAFSRVAAGNLDSQTS